MIQVRLLGTAAGGGFPQWNCNCACCRLARSHPDRARPRTQSCIAFSADGQRWFLLNASPDIHRQIANFPALLPPPDSVRGSSIEGVLLTNADLDHTLGLVLLREGRALSVHSTDEVRRGLSEGLNLDSALSRYCGIEWRAAPLESRSLPCSDGSDSGLHYFAFHLPGKPPRYIENKRLPSSHGYCVGYVIFEPASKKRIVFAPEVLELRQDTLDLLNSAELLLFDGTFWSEDEFKQAGVGTTLAAQMGHLPISGSSGSLQLLASLRCRHKVYCHINNTNPVLIEDSPERAAVVAAGVQVGYDGMEFVI